MAEPQRAPNKAVAPTDAGDAAELIVREARSISGHLGRLVEIQVDALDELGRLGLRQTAVGQALERGIDNSDLGWLVSYGLRRRLDEALRRRGAEAHTRTPTLAVGFFDLTGFTEAAGRLREDELGELLARFESLVWDEVTEAGGQVVKLIGDEAMLVCPSADAAADAAVDIVGATAKRGLPAVRAGLALGPLLARAGDYFGAAVNVAARLVDHADIGAVIVDERLQAALGDGFALEPLPPRSLKGI